MPHAPAQDDARGELLRRAGIALILAGFLCRAMSLLSPLPGWDIDPLVFGSLPGRGLGGVGPAESIVIDCAALLGAAMVVLGARAQRRAVWPDGVVALLVVVGAASVLWHARFGGPNFGPSIGDHRTGIAWLSAVCAGAALFLARRDAELRRAVAAIMLGFVFVLAAKGAQQLFIEHPQTVASYRADPARYLAGQGFSPDSPMARAFERRLLQAEATGWFGLANVYATFAAGFSVTLCVLAAFALKRGTGLQTAWRWIVGASAAGALAMLAAANAKGGVMAAGAGAGALAMALLAARVCCAPKRGEGGGQEWGASRAGWIGSALGALAVFGPIALVAVRGMIGERIGELSLLFRWFYMQGAARIFAAHPFGVGPDGFQQAYLLAKPPISPEEVTSPHSILFDWSATLGIAGFAWSALLVLAACAAGRSLFAHARPPATAQRPAMIERNSLRLVLIVPAVAVLAAAWLERGATTPETAVLRFVGLGLWCAAAVGAYFTLAHARVAGLALGAGALAVIAHTQIDVAASWTQSAGLVAVLVALAASSNTGPACAETTARRPVGALGLVLLAVVAAAMLNPARAMRWQSHLLAARIEVADVANVHERLDDLANGRHRGDSPAAIANWLSAAIADRAAHAPPRVEPTPDGLRRQIAHLESLALPRAAAHLRLAAQTCPEDWRPRREASRLYLRAAMASAEGLGDRPQALSNLDQAVAAMALPDPRSSEAETHWATSSEWRWLAIVHIERSRAAAAFGEPEQASQDAAGALAAYGHAARLDPWNLEVAIRGMRAARLAQDPAATRQWAARVLELAPLMRLDPMARGLRPEERAEAEDALRSP
ncbi:MAG: O-antigen ligase family protein [Phycisphaeraceae bacterium]|nr:O-antigen ligase family protein [Phycisphaeraceae bacterium]